MSKWWGSVYALDGPNQYEGFTTDKHETVVGATNEMGDLVFRCEDADCTRVRAILRKNGYVVGMFYGSVGVYADHQTVWMWLVDMDKKHG